MSDRPGAPGGMSVERGKRWTLVAILGATFMLLVDVTIVQVALPSIQRDLDAGFTSLQWVIDAYALSLAALILAAGSLADRFGRKRLFLAGVGVFTLASFVCGLAPTALFLNLARALQGVGGAAMFATALALIGQEFSGHARGTAIALWGSTVGGAVALGPLLGGVLTQWLGWQWVFFVNVPIGVAVIAIASATLNNIQDPDARHSDLFGLASFSSALSLVVFSLLRGNALGWSSATILATFGGSVLLFAIFVLVELRQARPMFDLSLFRKPAFCGVSLGTFAIGAGMFALVPYLTLYLQNILGYSPLEGGVRLLPLMVLTFLVPVTTRRLTARLPAGGVLAGGLGLVTVGLLLMRGVSADSRWTTLLAGMVVAGLGAGLANPAIAHIALAVVPPQRVGMASGISNTFRIAGLATGVAALGALLQDRVQARLHVLLPGQPDGLANALASGGTKAALTLAHGDPSLIVQSSRSAFASGLNEIMLVGSATLLIGTVAVLALVRARATQPTPAA